MAHFRPGMLLLAISIALASCAGGGSTLSATSPQPTCMPGVALYALIRDPMTQPAAGAVGVATTVGSITVPQADSVLGARLQLSISTGGSLDGSTFAANGSSLTATVPTLQPNTAYHATATGVPCGPYFDFGQFTTGAT
ncbi:MAG: hypothetical protein QOF71_2086 [Candidatus Eremiobacteraeota bacterium]|nr:hypothetical protein [Candidatus Eremiobacteraeota bacterium]